MKFLFAFLLIFLILACDMVERENATTSPRKVAQNSSNFSEDSIQSSELIDTSRQNIEIEDSLISEIEASILDAEDDYEYVDALTLGSGVRINWLERYRGRKLRDGELVLIEYRLGLPDGKIIDGNNKMKMPNLPFVVGYNMQNKGWDLALSELCVGDMAKIEIPSRLAYGKKGLGTVIPPNTDNWLFIKIHGLVRADFEEGGVKYWELRSGENRETNKRKVKFHMIASTKNKANIFNTYASNFPLTYTPGQKNYPKGLQQVLKKAKKGQQLFLILQPNMAYGDKGYLDLVGPNEAVFYNLKIIDVE